MPKTDASVRLTDNATVADRIALFFETFPTGRILTHMVSRDNRETVFRARVYRQESDAFPAATGWAAEREGDGDVNTVACVENTETSAVGRALANLGFTASLKRPSREEMDKVLRARDRTKQDKANRVNAQHIQQKADSFHDLFDLLSEAELLGFPATRSRLIRQRAAEPTGDVVPRIQRLENRIRYWLRRHEM
jgi:hypothetical protein